MEEMNSDNSQYKYEDIDRPYGYGKNYPYGWKKPCPYGKCSYGQKWPNWYGPYFPGGYYGGGFGFPWFLLALKSLSPRDAIRLIDEMENMEF
ncbi:MAG: hypothetical protein K0R72_1241 [Clostridia bacterium]|jgi:hypothetical protein|nr:hypothetical protein [Clostridia bacterium]